MNNRGFTMIELLAAMTLLAILSAITVPTVLSTMETTRQNTVVSDSKKFLSKIERLLQNNNNTIKKPRNGNDCIIVTLGYLEDTSDFQNGPHGYKYSTDMSYVVVMRVDNNYNYYVSLVEEYDDGSKGYYGIQNIFDDGSGSSKDPVNLLRTKEGKSKVDGISNPHNPTERNENDCTTSKSGVLEDAIKGTSCNKSITISNLYDKTRISC